jgi:hypothetical protein
MSSVLMIASGAFGALTVGNVKWVWWFFGMCWFLHIIFALGKSWAEAAKAKGGESGSVYSKIAGITVITWFCYPIVWVFAEGFGNFSVTFEVQPCLPCPTLDSPRSYRCYSNSNARSCPKRSELCVLHSAVFLYVYIRRHKVLGSAGRGRAAPETRAGRAQRRPSLQPSRGNVD